MQNKKITIIGLGLIGGSLARALRERAGVTDITVVTRSMESINAAVKDGVATRGFQKLNDYVYQSDIVFICTPVKKAFEYIDALSGNLKPDAIVTDVGSTKGEIIDYINSIENPPCFVGGHPMAGTEKTGYLVSFSHLFENAYYILSPSKSSNDSAINTMIGLIESIGGIPVIIDANEHDRVTGSISHVPHIIASALVNMVRELDSPDRKMQQLAAGGFKDITRIASSSPEMWENIVLSNGLQIKQLLDCFSKSLEDVKALIVENNSKGIYNFFETAKKYRDSFSAKGKSLINPSNDIIVDVVDKPGIIGEIATVLGQNNVNIKNINVSNSREFENGCLTITLPDSESVNSAFDLLVSKGYKVSKTI